MRSVIALLLVIVAVASAAPLLYSNNPRVINGSYIVVLKPNTELTTRDAHIMELHESATQVGDESFVGFRYGMGSFVGFSARLSEKFLQTELNHPDVLYIEADQVMKATNHVTQKKAEWGLARISTRANGATDYKYNTTAGSGVDVFVIDTGIFTSHVDFGGRATAVFNSIPGESGQDLNGHGTHCAGTIGGATYGVAKKVALKGVKVLDKDGSGSNSGVIAGVDYVTNNRVKSRPTVASMSLGGGPSNALDAAVIDSIDSGIVYSIAAGNEDADACNSSPARVKPAVTVGATDDSDYRAWFSNWGKCVDIFAPGVNITSDWIGTTTSTNAISGTSMATPHVAGVLALHLSSYPSLTPSESADWIIKVADKKVVIDPKGSPNYLLYSPSD